MISKIQEMDPYTLIREARKDSKNLKKEAELTVYILSSYSIQYFSMVLRYALRQNGFNVSVIEGDYNSINMDVLDENSMLYKSNPDIVILLPYYKDIKDYPALMADDKEIISKLNDEMEYYSLLWKSISKICNVQIFQSNFVVPPERQLGNMELEKYSKNSFLQLINRKFVEASPKNVTIVDLEFLAQKYGKINWFDKQDYYLHKTGISNLLLGPVCNQFAAMIQAFKAKGKKCLVLDLDNTLWGGVVSEDGYDGIILDPNNAVGEAFLAFQEYVLQLSLRGVIIAVCSKNDEAVAKEPFLKNENMILKLENISCFIANWENKAENVRRIAEEIGIGLDSMVFFDDNPVERKIVNDYVPEVLVIDVPDDPADYVDALESQCSFEILELTSEDISRTESYYKNQQRKEFQAKFVNYNEYLESLKMTGKVELITESDIPRFTQLINKSNQFNLRTQRYSQSEIEKMFSDQQYILLKAELEDVFTRYGIISCVILEKRENVCFIDTWLMSCRVLKRDVEKMMMNGIYEYAKKEGCTEIRGEYIPTKKNAMVRNLLSDMGFEKYQSVDDNEFYALSINNYKEKNIYIERRN